MITPTATRLGNIFKATHRTIGKLPWLSEWFTTPQRTTFIIKGIDGNGPFKKTITSPLARSQIFDMSFYGGSAYGIKVGPGGAYLNGQMLVDDNCTITSIKATTSTELELEPKHIVGFLVFGAGLGTIIFACGRVVKLL
ncbi:uncharacterized protein F4807DRAFT_456087 [Annulohypoxylon truncatum]|uniref:uncharacterized protein n=1 Tax=Annulohypoxylon truncatum TaxID=327061 RepID=UPI002007C790|nr:uncharacterized protein F4807DRAFT_456087 [Annulohypoxylon truncatum]KAI1214446.1 hypothetical protein F4807DRAFT_456087 [Annulohypoxylon truncatum]